MIKSTTSLINLNTWNTNDQTIHQCVKRAILDGLSPLPLLIFVISIICKMKINNAIVDVAMTLHCKIFHHLPCSQDKNWKYDSRINGSMHINQNNSLSSNFLKNSQEVWINGYSISYANPRPQRATKIAYS